MKQLAALSIFALHCLCAQAQALNPTWEGEWVAVETTQGPPGARVRIARTGPSTQLLAGDRTCQLAYDDTVTPGALLLRLQGLRQWQLDATHWPKGTDPAQLIGLAREFDKAQALVQGMGADNYRRVRLKGAGCEGADDVFLLLHRGQELLRFAFSETSLGVALVSFRRQR